MAKLSAGVLGEASGGPGAALAQGYSGGLQQINQTLGVLLANKLQGEREQEAIQAQSEANLNNSIALLEAKRDDYVLRGQQLAGLLKEAPRDKEGNITAEGYTSAVAQSGLATPGFLASVFQDQSTAGMESMLKHYNLMGKKQMIEKRGQGISETDDKNSLKKYTGGYSSQKEIDAKDKEYAKMFQGFQKKLRYFRNDKGEIDPNSEQAKFRGVDYKTLITDINSTIGKRESLMLGTNQYLDDPKTKGNATRYSDEDISTNAKFLELFEEMEVGKDGKVSLTDRSKALLWKLLDTKLPSSLKSGGE